MRVVPNEIDGIIQSFHEAAACPELWRTALQKISSFFQAEGASLSVQPYAKENTAWSESLDTLYDTCFTKRWHKHNTRLERMCASPHNRSLFTEADIFSISELDTLPFNVKLINPQGFRWFAACFLGSGNASSALLSLERKAEQAPFDSAQIQALRNIQPHLGQAVDMGIRYTIAYGEGMLDAFEKVNRPALLINMAGKVLRHNRKTENYVGSYIQIRHGELATDHREANESLKQLISDIFKPQTQTKPQSVVALSRPNGPQIFVYGLPVIRSHCDIFQRTRAIITLVDPVGRIQPPKLLLRQGFKLTPAETRLATALAQGYNLDKYAALNKICVGTARIQLKSVMAKTSTHRQAELVSLLAQYAQAFPTSDT
jgi:DNA-binding CsgD family transcriptional regulator